nr:MAG TPA: hypothetical protein [Bacteriophage sp.]
MTVIRINTVMRFWYRTQGAIKIRICYYYFYILIFTRTIKY